MKINFQNLLISLGLCASFASANEVQWPNGKNVCTGTWTYTELSSCEYGVDTTKPIKKFQGKYEQMTEACRYIGGPQEPTGEKITKSVGWDDSRKHPTTSCSRIQDPPQGDAYTKWIVVDHKYEYVGTTCRKRNRFRQCTSRDYQHKTTCTWEKWDTVPKATDGKCKKVDDKTKPIYELVGYEPKVGYDESCPQTKKSTPKFFDATAIMRSPALKSGSLQCSTFDNTPGNTPTQITEKFDALISFATELSDLEGRCEEKEKVLNYLTNVVNMPNSDLTADQVDFAFLMIELLSECSLQDDSSEPANEIDDLESTWNEYLNATATPIRFWDKDQTMTNALTVTFSSGDSGAVSIVTAGSGRYPETFKYFINRSDKSITIERLVYNIHESKSVSPTDAHYNEELQKIIDEVNSKLNSPIIDDVDQSIVNLVNTLLQNLIVN
ncbi:MAG: hypothetical protein ACOH5I_25350 [Oligoflexus sp.]